MNELKILVDLCLFQAKPQDFPYSQGWMSFTALVLATAIYISYPAQEQASAPDAGIVELARPEHGRVERPA